VAVLPGSATIVVDVTTVPAGYSLTTANQTQVVTALAGQQVAAADVGYGPQLGSIAGTLFIDLDGDPNRDSYEPPLAGLTVQLVSGSTVVGTTTSAVNGSYSFANRAAGSYTVRVVAATIPTGYAASTDYDGGTDGSAVAVITAGNATAGVDFGHRGTGTIGDTVWLDDNEDGYVDEFEDPIADAEITLTWWGPDGLHGTSDDHTFAPQITDDNGFYRFSNLPPGTYSLTVDAAGVGVGLDPTTATTVQVVLVAGASNMAADFGFALVAQLPFTGLAAEHLILASALMIGLGALVVADGRKRERKFKIALERIE
jgi:hypothetical protein